MKFINPDGKPEIKSDRSPPNANNVTTNHEQSLHNDGEQPREAMTFHGDTTQVDTRKGKPNTLQESQALEQVAIEKKRHGCFYRGCMTLLVILILLLIIILGSVRAFKNKVTPYLGDKGLPIPEVTIDETKVADALLVVDQLQGKQPIDAGTKELTIGKEQINQLIAHYQTTHNFSGKVFVAFPSDNNIVVYGTVPLDTYTLNLFKDKRLNVIVQLSGSYHDNLVDANIVKIMLGDQDATDLYKNIVGSLTVNQPDDLEVRARLERFDKIYTAKNKVYFQLK